MKIRTDYVTNSSSSSFVIAKNSKCTIDEIKEKLRENQKNIEYTMNLFDMSFEEIPVEKFISNVAEMLFDHRYPMKLGDWSVFGDIYYNEGDIFEAFICDYGELLNTENFKVEAT